MESQSKEDEARAGKSKQMVIKSEVLNIVLYE